MNIDIPNYTLLKKLGAGAFAEVWLAEHRKNRRKAAIKILKSDVEAGGQVEALFLREGEVLASFSERNIVAIFDNAQVGNTAYLIMEYLAGGSLLDRMNQRGIEVGEAIGHVVQIAAALDAAHRKQIIHRDLKPANIMLRDETTPVLTDFGASRQLQRSTIYGKDGGIVGTPHYMSPEQITGQPLDGRSDLYALGIMFHELLTGRLPYNGNVNEILALHLHGPLPQLPANLAVLQPVLDRLLAKDPAQRFGSGEEMAQALRRCFLDQVALRQLVDYASTSAWSSQLKALGFDLDTAERREVRIAQGEFLRQESELTRPLPPALPQPPPVPAVPALHRPASHWVQQTAAVALAISLLALGVIATLGLNTTLEAGVVGALPAALVLFAAMAWQGRQQGRSWWLLLNGVALLVGALALWVAWNYVHDSDREPWKPWMWLLPLTLLALALLSLTALGLARRNWLMPLITAGVLCASWLIAVWLGDQGHAGLLLAWLACVLTAAMWLWLALSVPRQHPGLLSPHARIGWPILLLLLLVPLALPLQQGLSRWQEAHVAIRGEWSGLSPIGPVKVDFERGGAAMVYPLSSGQRPWQSRWQIHERWDEQMEVQLQLGERDTSSYTATEVPWSASNSVLAFEPGYFDSLSLKSQPSPLPLRLQRGAPSQDLRGVVPAFVFNCPSNHIGSLRLNADGSGELQLEQEGDNPVRQPLTWARFGSSQGNQSLHFVVLQPWAEGLTLISGQLSPSGQLRVRPLRDHIEYPCSVFAPN